MMDEKGFFQPVTDAFRGTQRKTTLILLSSCLLMITWRYIGSPGFFMDHLSRYVVLGDDPGASSAVYSMVACFVLLGLLPALGVKIVFGERLRDYGVGWGNRTRTFRTAVLLVPLFVLGGYYSARDPAMAAEYPMNPSARDMFALHALCYLIYYMGWEFHFRGFLLFGLRDRLAPANALFVQVLASTLLHVGKPATETFAAILGGILWALVAYRTRSLVSGLLQHYALGLTLDTILCWQGIRP
ncbi:MAG: CPBP family intramembrane metalloprotease [Pirellulales bacterium]|nr:CPBP family intramembrane metalloprotease [Pirellulales bacterium]